MVNMKSDPKTAEETTACCAPGDAPAYPYGLTICLNAEALQKLGMTGLPVVGSKVRISAMATVTSVSQRQEADGDEQKSVDLQITDMDPPKPAGAMYDNSDMNP